MLFEYIIIEYYFLGIAAAMKNVTHLVTTDTVDHTNVAK